VPPSQSSSRCWSLAIKDAALLRMNVFVFGSGSSTGAYGVCHTTASRVYGSNRVRTALVARRSPSTSTLQRCLRRIFRSHSYEYSGEMSVGDSALNEPPRKRAVADDAAIARGETRNLTQRQPRNCHILDTLRSNAMMRKGSRRPCPDARPANANNQSCRTTVKSEGLTLRPPLYSISPSFRNLFMKKLTRERVAPIISASVSWEIFGSVRAGLS
jgi:hypothetical protein